jgi:tetratricopeptide (TPR) repeat protein
MKGERLPAAADDLLMPFANVRCARPTRYATPSVNSIRSQFRKLEADPFAIRAQAASEIWYGDLGEARKLLDKLLVADAQNAETQHLSGLCDLRAAYKSKDMALFKKARGSFAAAQKIDVTRANSLFRYVECGVQEAGGRFDEHFADVALMTYRLAPQVDGYAQALALALMQQKRFAEAVRVLRPQIADSHDSHKALVVEFMNSAKAEKEPVFVWPESAAAIDETET